MNKLNKNLILMSVILTIAAYGCGQRAQNSQEAIELSKEKAIHHKYKQHTTHK